MDNFRSAHMQKSLEKLVLQPKNPSVTGFAIAYKTFDLC